MVVETGAATRVMSEVPKEVDRGDTPSWVSSGELTGSMASMVVYHPKMVKATWRCDQSTGCELGSVPLAAANTATPPPLTVATANRAEGCTPTKVSRNRWV